MASLSKFYSIVLSVVALWSVIARFSLYNLGERAGVFVYGMFFVITFAVMLLNKGIFSQSNIKYAVTISAPFVFVYFFSSFFNHWVVDTTPYLMLGYLFFLIYTKDTIKDKAFGLFIKLMVSLLFLSLIEYFIYRFSGLTVIIGTVENPGALRTVYFEHALFNLYRIGDDIVRFQSLANEPGLVGTLCGLLLFTIGQNERYKKDSYVLWVAGICTFSFAFYILAAIRIVTMAKGSLKNTIIIIAAISVLGYYFWDSINELVWERATSENHGDNRSDYYLDFAFAAAIKDGSILFGKGYRSYISFIESGVGGGKVWIYQFGIVGFLMILFSYSYTLIKKAKYYLVPSRVYMLYLLVFWLSFYQRQTIDTPYAIMVFISAPLVMSNGKSFKTQ